MSLKVTDKGAQKILSLIQEDPHTPFFRVMVLGGGCAGFQYTFSLEATPQEEDKIFESGGVQLVVDEASLALLEGVEIDYVQDMMGASFQIKNPNAITSCGCGNSFSV